ncbi:MAG: 1-acyl-sn-glycerol-3-phosphate acyltransferase [Oscillospiraceae bacterium]|nr:1-acyl-sn-glycerol-3-phosphate acyltransferase [Oscillospiraceae bacterium]
MKKQKHPRKPLGWLYGFAVFTLGNIIRMYFRMKIDRSEIKGMKGPLIAIANHQSNTDFIKTALAMWPLKLNFLVSSYYLNSGLLRYLFKKVGAISKKQFVPDTPAVLAAYRAILNKQSIIIFPEGQVEYYGAEVAIDESIAKLIKRFRVPVVNIQLRGGFLSNGKWSKRAYPARVEIGCSVLLNTEQIAAMSEDEILTVVKEGLTYNEYDWQREKMIPSSKKRLTKGLENILTRCPSCNHEFAMTSDKDTLSCSYCGYTVRLNRYGFFEAVGSYDLIYDNTVDWFRMQQREIQKEMLVDTPPYISECTLRSTKHNRLGYFYRGRGVLTLDTDGLSYDGTRDGEPYSELFSIKTQIAVTHSAIVWGIDFIGEDCNYAFCPDDPRKMIRIVEMYSILRKSMERDELE